MGNSKQDLDFVRDELNKVQDSVIKDKEILQFTTLLERWARAVHRLYGTHCIVCKETFKDLKHRTSHFHAHHIYPKEDYPEFALEIWNCVMLCRNHHELAHTWYQKYDLKTYLKKLEGLVRNAQ